MFCWLNVDLLSSYWYTDDVNMVSVVLLERTGELGCSCLWLCCRSLGWLKCVLCFVFRQQVIFVWSVLSAQQNVGHIVFSCCENWWPSGTNITSGIICTRSAGGRRINTPTTACRWRPINWASDGADTKVWRPDVNVSFQLCVDSSETLSKQLLLLLTAQLQSMFHPAERVRYIWSKPGVHLSRSRQKHSLNWATWIDGQLFQTFLIMNTENIHFYEWFSCFGRTRRLQKTNCCQL